MRLLLAVGLLLGLVGCQLPIEPVAQPTVTPQVASTPTATVTLHPTPTTSLPTATATATSHPTVVPPSPMPPACLEAGITIEGNFESAIEGPTRTYRVYLPPCYEEQTRAYPVLYLLHGNLYGQEEWDTIDIDGQADDLISAGTIEPLIIIMPEGRTLSDNTSGGDGSYETVIVEELLPHVDATYRVDGRRAIGGLSRGGYWAAEIGFRHPTLFTAVGMHAPAFLDIGQDRAINPIWTVESADLRDLCIAIDYGANDVYLHTAKPIRDALLSRAIAHSWTIYPDQGHTYPYWSDHRQDYIRWYAKQWADGECG